MYSIIVPVSCHFFLICNHGKLPFSTWPIKKLVQELIWNSKVCQKISMPLFAYNLQKKRWMVSFKWLVWMLKGLLCLKDIKSVWLPNDFPEIHIHSSVYFMITNTVSALHLWLIEAVNVGQWCIVTCAGFLGVQCFHIHVEISTDYIEEEIWWIVVFLDCIAWQGNKK